MIYPGACPVNILTNKERVSSTRLSTGIYWGTAGRHQPAEKRRLPLLALEREEPVYRCRRRCAEVGQRHQILQVESEAVQRVLIVSFSDLGRWMSEWSYLGGRAIFSVLR
jgi:hypothetical protein